MPFSIAPLGKLWLLLVVALLAGCGSPAAVVPPPATPASASGLRRGELQAGYEAALAGDFAGAAELLGPLAAQDSEAAELLATVRLAKAMQDLTAHPGDPAVARSALDQVSLALALATEPTLRQTLSDLQGSLLALLTTEDARLALEQLRAADAAPAELAVAARGLAERADRLAASGSLPQGVERVTAAAFLSAAAVFEAAGDEAGRAEARALCERATVAAPEDLEAQACLARLAEQAAAPAQPAAPAASEAQAPAPRPRPAAPAVPAAPTYSVAQRKSFDGSGNSGQYASCVDVQVIGPAGPVSGAVIGINNGEHSYQNQTDQQGYAGRCGLGASTWSVVLFWTPAGSMKDVTTTVYLNGAPEQRAAVVFQGRSG